MALTGKTLLHNTFKAIRDLVFKPIQTESGSTIIFVVILAVIGSLLIGSISLSSRFTIKKSGHKREKVGALFIAEAGKERVIGNIRSGEFNPTTDTKATIYSNVAFGAGTYTVVCSTNATNDMIWIFSTGKTGTDSVQLEVKATLGAGGGSGFGWARGAITAKPSVGISGNAEFDGQDYDTSGTTADGRMGSLLGGGTYGVVSGGTVSTGGSGTIGGVNPAGVTTPPQAPALPGFTVEENIDVTNYPTTPEEVLGLLPGAFDPYKCTTCPPSTFYGIVYQELGKNDKPCYFEGGILIVHNSSGNASLENYHNDFKGLIIADDVKHFNAQSTVLGAVVMLGNTFSGNVAGNGGTKIRYSSKALSRALSLPIFPPSKRNVEVVSWREIN